MRFAHFGFGLACVCMACSQVTANGGGNSGQPSSDQGGKTSPGATSTVAIATSSNSVQACSTTPSIVASNVDAFAAGGGSLGFIQGTTVAVLRAADTTPKHFTMPVPARYVSGIDVDNQFVSYGFLPTDPTASAILTSVDYVHGTAVDLVQTEVIIDVVAASHHVFFESSGPDFAAPVPLTNASADGTSSSVLSDITQSAGPLLRNADSIAWVDQNGFSTMPSDGSAAPVSHGDLGQLPVALGDGFALISSSSSLSSITLDTHATTQLATLLPAKYPAEGAPSPMGVGHAAIGASNTYWSECWGNGGAGKDGSALTNWVVRSVPNRGGDARIVDSFTWSAGAATTGTCPQLAADGGAIYWTHEGALMRMCE